MNTVKKQKELTFKQVKELEIFLSGKLKQPRKVKCKRKTRFKVIKERKIFK